MGNFTSAGYSAIAIDSCILIVSYYNPLYSMVHWRRSYSFAAVFDKTMLA